MNLNAQASARILSQIFLDTEKVFGSRDSCFLAMDSMKDAVCSFSGTSDELQEEITSLAKSVTSMSPRIALLIMMVFNVLHEYNEKRGELCIEDEKKLLCGIIDDVKKKRLKSVQKLLKFSEGIIVDGDTVLLHDISHTVFDIIRRAKSLKINFTVLVAEQERRQTEAIVSFLQQLHVPFTVIPEYLLIHVIQSINKAFLGAVTINSRHEVIADAGSEAVISQMLYHKIPVYVPITTDKLSLWEAKQQHHSLKTTKQKTLGGEEYDKLVFSHDRYSVDQVTEFITNKGRLTPDQLKKLYDEYFRKRELWRKKTGV